MNFKNPPIKEATIEVRVVFESSSPSAQALSDFATSIEGFSKEFKHMITKQLIMQGSPEGESIQNSNVYAGTIIQSLDKQYLVKVMPDGLAVIRVGKYLSGDELFRTFIGIWNLYSKKFAPQGLGRFALRFINDFSLPTSISEHKRYIAISPDTGHKKLNFDGFGVSIGMKSNDAISQANVYVEVTPIGDKAKALIDIDAFQVFDNPKDVSHANLELSFNALRDFKNSIFNEVVSDDARKLFN